MTKADGEQSFGIGPDDSPSPRRSVLLGWIVLVLIVTALPAQAAWYTLMASEPYPALTQPPFRTVPGAGGALAGETTSLAAVLRGGSSVPIEADELFSESWNQGSFVVAAVIDNPDLDIRSRDRIRAELSKFVPAGADITHLRAVIEEREYRIDENSSRAVSGPRTVLIPLGNSE